MANHNIFQAPKQILLTSEMVRASSAYKNIESLICKAREEEALELEELEEKLRAVREEVSVMKGSLLEGKHQIWGMLTEIVGLEDKIEQERTENSYEGESEYNE